eukprot:XP_024445935.1 protein DOWNY MILDEW RESISTANCE 6 isoform X2 [Populus trichocarpa]
MDPEVISSGVHYTNLPASYVRPESERPRLSEVSTCQDVPVIDLGCQDRNQIVQQVGDACDHYGFFQEINHGMSLEEKMLGVAHDFFSLPVEEKLKLYSDDPSRTMRLSTSFNVNKEKVHNWRDYLRLHCYPLDKYVPEWPSNPPPFKRFISLLCEIMPTLGMTSTFLLLLLLATLFHLSHGDVGTCAHYRPPYVPTACDGNSPSQFPLSNMFAAAGERIWDNGSACGRQYEVKCISGAFPGTCLPDQTVQVRIVDQAQTSRSRPSSEGATIVLSSTAFGTIADPSATSVNVEFQQ